MAARISSTSATPRVGFEPWHGVLVLAAVLIALLPLGLGGYALYLATVAVLFALAAMALDLVVGYLGLTPLGQVAFFGLGGYGAGLAMIYLGAPWPFALGARVACFSWW
jgi:branched-chain amino acid transport system permease protein